MGVKNNKTNARKNSPLTARGLEAARERKRAFALFARTALREAAMTRGRYMVLCVSQRREKREEGSECKIVLCFRHVVWQGCTLGYLHIFLPWLVHSPFIPLSMTAIKHNDLFFRFKWPCWYIEKHTHLPIRDSLIDCYIKIPCTTCCYLVFF